LIPLVVIILSALLGLSVIWFKAKESGPLGELGRKEAWAGYFFAGPWIIGFVVFTIGPILASLVFSFCDYDILHAPRWAGLTNYQGWFSDDWEVLGKALGNVAFLSFFGISLGIVTGLSIAMLLNCK